MIENVGHNHQLVVLLEIELKSSITVNPITFIVPLPDNLFKFGKWVLYKLFTRMMHNSSRA